MLKRNDISKQFELVVQQEIINHNDQMLATNLSLNELRKSLDVQKREFDHYKALCNSENLKRKSNFDRLSSLVENNKSDAMSKMNDILQAFDAANKRLDDFHDLIHNFDKTLEHEKEKIIEIIEFHDACFDVISKELKELKSSIAKISSDSFENFNKYKVEMAAKPSEAEKVKKELLEIINTQKIDFSGLMEEIQAYKKDAFIKEKKLENIYTLIERLDKRI